MVGPDMVPICVYGSEITYLRRVTPLPTVCTKQLMQGSASRNNGSVSSYGNAKALQSVFTVLNSPTVVFLIDLNTVFSA
jgi:hypothetical protein